MNTIRTAEQLQQLSDQVAEVRTNVRTKAERNYFFWEGKKELDDLNRGLTTNERHYTRLPVEIKVSDDIGKELSILLDEFDKKKKSIDPSEAVLSMMKTTGHTIAAIAFPNTHSITGAVSHGLGSVRKLTTHLNQREGLKKVASDSILGSYKLEKTDTGEFILRRGKWSLFCINWDGPRGSTNTELVLGVDGASLTDLVFPPHFCNLHPMNARSR